MEIGCLPQLGICCNLQGLARLYRGEAPFTNLANKDLDAEKMLIKHAYGYVLATLQFEFFMITTYRSLLAQRRLRSHKTSMKINYISLQTLEWKRATSYHTSTKCIHDLLEDGDLL